MDSEAARVIRELSDEVVDSTVLFSVYSTLLLQVDDSWQESPAKEASGEAQPDLIALLRRQLDEVVIFIFFKMKISTHLIFPLLTYDLFSCAP